MRRDSSAFNPKHKPTMTAFAGPNSLLDNSHHAHQRGDQFDALFLTHYDRVYGLLYRLVGTRDEAEDLAQEVFLKLHERPDIQEQGNVGAWLYRVATNAGYNAIRGRKRRWSWQRWLVHTDSLPTPDALLERAEEQAAVRDALAQLKPQQAQLLLLRHMGLSYAEVAAACDLNPNSVGKQLARASQAFRSAYSLIAKEQTDA